jgi:heterotetrameric sarcosine oxidase gamma subunit
MSQVFAFMSPSAVARGGDAALLRTPMERSHLAAGATLTAADGWRLAEYEATPGDAWLADVSHLGKLDVQGSSERIDELTGGLELGRASHHEDVWTMRLSPVWAVVLCPFDRVGELAERIGEGVTDMTCGWAAVTIGGSHVRDVFMRSSGMDVRESSFGPGRCAGTSVMRVQATVLNEGDDRITMLIGWEFGEYFWESIIDAGHGFEIAAVSASATSAVSTSEEVA